MPDRDRDRNRDRAGEQPSSAPMLDAAIEYASYGVAILPSHHPIGLDLEPEAGAQGRGSPITDLECSCRDPDCATPAAHPFGPISIHHATVNAGRIARWFTAFPEANIASPAGTSFEVLQLRHPAPVGQLLAWLTANEAIHGIEPGPILTTGTGSLRFLVRTGEHTDPHAPEPLLPTEIASRINPDVRRLAHGILVLLPPSRLVNRAKVTWVRPFDAHMAMLPDGRHLLDLLMQLPDVDLLNEWSRTRPTGQRHDAGEERDDNGAWSWPGVPWH